MRFHAQYHLLLISLIAQYHLLLFCNDFVAKNTNEHSFVNMTVPALLAARPNLLREVSKHGA